MGLKVNTSAVTSVKTTMCKRYVFHVYLICIISTQQRANAAGGGIGLNVWGGGVEPHPTVWRALSTSPHRFGLGPLVGAFFHAQLITQHAGFDFLYLAPFQITQLERAIRDADQAVYL